MAYTILARKYRPQDLAEIAGQEHVVTTLSNAIKFNRIAHAYLFAGPRGTGKTTTARVLAKSLNCVKGSTVTPCNECDSCKEIRDSISLDVIEIDGASNNSVDDIRSLREGVKFASAGGKYKVYIIDEVHMLSESAFNALLKTLEEPPAHVIFIFATTEPNEIPPTVLSRCQRFNFKRIHLPTIVQRVREIAQAEKIELTEEAAYTLSQRAEGSLRDVLSLLDQVVAFGGENITNELVLKTLGLVDQQVFFTFTEHILKKDSKAAISLFNQIVDEGADVSEFVSSLNLHFRNLLLAKLNLASEQMLEIPQSYVEKYQQASQKFEENDLMRMLKIVQELGAMIKNADPKISTEIALLRLAKLDQSIKIDELLSKLREGGTSSGTHSPASQPNIQQTSPEKDSDLPKTSQFTDVKHGTAYAVKADSTDIQAAWQQVLEKLRKEKPSLGTFLQDVHLTAFDTNELHLEFAGDRVFQKQLVEKKENLTYLQKLAQEILGPQYKIKLDLNSAKSSPAKAVPSKAKPDLEALKQKDPLIKDILDSFQGEVI
ncbi:MAG: DNA polymerase III, subunit gamma and tau [candidate division Zixibacteria bacterium RBG_16_50_21]|nr:MAG: DNA polymerase III, subunit gamma and tau [candidate division Zixibacteria bacterium RBG_16_50_21]